MEHKNFYNISCIIFPPKPVLITCMSELIREKRKAAAVVISKKVIDCPLFLSSHSSSSELKYLLLII